MARKRRLVAAVFAVCALLAGCGGDDGDGQAAATTAAAATSTTSPTSTSDATTTTAGFSGTLIEIKVTGDQVETAERRVTVDAGERVRIRVESDVADEVHVHGYDLKKDVAPGKPATIEFTANVEGSFEVELEAAHRKLIDLQVR
jgi:ABC-type glycerol-3-phosphate transport system substrate-binding protein